MAKESVGPFVSEEVLEVRYTPKGSFLNNIGDVADYVVDKGLFPHWKIETNTINFFDSEDSADKLFSFVSFRNAGLISFDSPTRNYFRDKASAFWKVYRENPHFKIPAIQRVGVRNKCFVKLALDFALIEQRLFDTFFKSEVTDILGGGTRTDFQVVFDFDQKDWKLRATLGPLRKDEARRNFRQDSEHFSSAGLFIDLDAYIDRKDILAADVEKFLRQSSEAMWTRIDSFAAKLGA